MIIPSANSMSLLNLNFQLMSSFFSSELARFISPKCFFKAFDLVSTFLILTLS